MIYDKNNKYLRIFIKSFRENIHPLSCSPRGVFVNLRVTFKLLLFDYDRTSVMGGFILSSSTILSSATIF